jgi:hypothetical protein
MKLDLVAPINRMIEEANDDNARNALEHAQRLIIAHTDVSDFRSALIRAHRHLSGQQTSSGDAVVLRAMVYLLHLIEVVTEVAADVPSDA